MSQYASSVKPLYLSAEEAMGLLDLCLMSQAAIDPDKERAIMKLTDLVRGYIAEAEESECVAVCTQRGAFCTASGETEDPAMALACVSAPRWSPIVLPHSSELPVPARLARRIESHCCAMPRYRVSHASAAL